MMDSHAYRDFIEEKVLDLLDEGLSSGSMSVERAQEISGFILDSLKENMTLDQIYVAIQMLKAKAPELNSVIFEALNQYDEIKKGTFSKRNTKSL